MSSILAPSQRVHITAKICDSNQVEHLRDVMSPSLLHLGAYKWAKFEATSLAKDLADAAAQHDEIEFVMHFYIIIMVTLEHLTCRFKGNRQEYFMIYPEVAEALSLLELETMVNIACAMLKLGETDDFCSMFEKISAFFEQRAADPGGAGELPPGLAAYCRSLELWYSLCRNTFERKETVRETVERFASSERGPH